MNKQVWILILITIAMISCQKKVVEQASTDTTLSPKVVETTSAKTDTAIKPTMDSFDSNQITYDTIYSDEKTLQNMGKEGVVLLDSVIDTTSTDTVKTKRVKYRLIIPKNPGEVLQESSGDKVALREYYGLVFPAIEGAENEALLDELHIHLKFIWGRIKENDMEAISMVFKDMQDLKKKLITAAPESYIKERGGQDVAEYRKLRNEMYSNIDGFIKWYNSSTDHSTTNDHFQQLLKSKRNVERFRPGKLYIKQDGTYIWDKK
jgi:hypothetical protein